VESILTTAKQCSLLSDFYSMVVWFIIHFRSVEERQIGEDWNMILALSTEGEDRREIEAEGKIDLQDEKKRDNQERDR
jgi:hypothetical protein